MKYNALLAIEQISTISDHTQTILSGRETAKYVSIFLQGVLLNLAGRVPKEVFDEAVEKALTRYRIQSGQQKPLSDLTEEESESVSA